MSINTIVPESSKAMYDNFHFAPAVRSNGHLLCSGQIGSNPDGSIPDSAEEEFRIAWRAVGTVLEAAGLGFDNIVEYTSYHVGMEHLQAFMKTRDEVLREPWPAWTAIGISGLAVPGARVEIRVTAQYGNE